MAEAADRPCRELAYGDVKRVELAIALASDPRLLLMDEPTAGMAPRERNELIALVKSLVVERGVSVLFTEHSMDVVFAFADRIIVMARGRLIADGDADDDPQRPDRARGLFRQRPHFERGARAVMTAPPLHSRSMQASTPGTAPRTFCYDVSFTVGRGEVVALMGRNGAGKSTTMKAVMGLLPRRSGTVRFNGARRFRAASRSRSRAAASASRRKTAASFPTSPCWKISTSAVSRRAAIADGTPGAGRGRRKRCSGCSPISPRCATAAAADMSGGEQQMLTIARTLMGNPLLVLLDEPSEGIAPVIVEQIADTIVELKKRRPVDPVVRAECRLRRDRCRTAPTCWRRDRSAGPGRWRSFRPTRKSSGCTSRCNGVRRRPARRRARPVQARRTAEQAESAPCPVLCRASTPFEPLPKQNVDGRDRPGHDDSRSADNELRWQRAGRIR